MARITIEDCMEQVPNRFQLVRMASIRAKQLKKGARPLVSADENKEVVTSLREIAAALVKPGDVEEVEPEAFAPVESALAAPAAEAAAPDAAAPAADAAPAEAAPSPFDTPAE